VRGIMKTSKDSIVIKIWFVWNAINIILTCIGLVAVLLGGIAILVKLGVMNYALFYSLNVLYIIASACIIIGILKKSLLGLYASYLYLLLETTNAVDGLFHYMNIFGLIKMILVWYIVYEFYKASKSIKLS
jgi:hypothetical protein